LRRLLILAVTRFELVESRKVTAISTRSLAGDRRIKGPPSAAAARDVREKPRPGARQGSHEAGFLKLPPSAELGSWRRSPQHGGLS
jgi:hypothetical protein